MIPIPGFIISIITFPGVIVHEFAHFLFCRIFGVAVFEVCYFRAGNPAGYVIHEPPRYAWQHVLIGIGPFFVNTIIGVLIALPAAVNFQGTSNSGLLDLALMYLGISIAMHSFPSTGDAQSIWNTLWDPKTPAPALLKIISTPLVGLIYIGAFASIIWMDALYGYGAVTYGAKLVVRLFS